MVKDSWQTVTSRHCQQCSSLLVWCDLI